MLYVVIVGCYLCFGERDTFWGESFGFHYLYHVHCH